MVATSPPGIMTSIPESSDVFTINEKQRFLEDGVGFDQQQSRVNVIYCTGSQFVRHRRKLLSLLLPLCVVVSFALYTLDVTNAVALKKSASEAMPERAR